MHQNIYLPIGKMKIEPDLRLCENLVEVNDKEGGEETKVENLGFAQLYILLYELQTKNTPKTACTFSIGMKMSNKKHHSLTILDKSPWDSTAIFIFFCHFCDCFPLLRGSSSFSKFSCSSPSPSTFRFQACHMHALMHSSVIDVITCVLIFFERL